MNRKPNIENKIKSSSTHETRSADGVKVTPPPRIIKKEK